MFQQDGDRPRQAAALNNLGLIQHQLGRYREAISLYRQALATYRETGDQVGTTITLANMGECEERQGRYALAARHLRQAMGIAADIGPPRPCSVRPAPGTVRPRLSPGSETCACGRTAQRRPQGTCRGQ